MPGLHYVPKPTMILEVDLADGSRVVGTYVQVAKSVRCDFRCDFEGSIIHENSQKGLVTLTVLSDVLGEISLDAFHVTGLKINGKVVENVKGGDPLCVFGVLVGEITGQAP